MHAVRLHAFGPAENLTYEKVPDPVPAPGEVRVAVAAAGVHLLDTALREGGGPGPYPPPDLPTIPGREIAGTVDALGEGTDPAWLGKRVVAHIGMRPGGYAELVTTEAGRLHEIPPGLDEAAAVAMIGTGRTTMAFLHFAELTPADVVLVTAAAGGVGSLFVQYGRNLGATVVGLAGGPAKVRRVTELGADVAADYTDPSWPARVTTALAGRTPTVLLDTVGGGAARAALDLLGKGGRHLILGWSSGAPLEVPEEERHRRGITSRSVLGPNWLDAIGGVNPLRRMEEAALTEAAAGRLTPAVQRFPLAGAAAAHRALEGRGTMGKVVLLTGI
ncbi:2-haloacrylate reductase [Streptomyces sp. RB5]|uniref:2-haloacrylate reductase n=1 Tax=Streptomyces smaragdinus TaxID=2585196 RepID=A0A7K0CHV9_9ACTN|nr:zinc-binding dehydrogenase [Streptomyces smaragdinus]MQY13071.1 2-haloacrylate reductase [Streptomyces smaragdinus]